VLSTLRTSIGGLTAAEEVYEVTDEVRDVTGEYVDAAARAASLEATRKQLQALMVRADDVRDVLEVQREFAQVTAQVEAKQAAGAGVKATRPLILEGDDRSQSLSNVFRGGCPLRSWPASASWRASRRSTWSSAASS